MTRAGIVRQLYAEHVEARPHGMFTSDSTEQSANTAWRERADDWGFYHVDSFGHWDGDKSPVIHSEECIGLHATCTSCDRLNVCVSEFGARELCDECEKAGALV